jgi:dihydrofolate reductase
MRKITVFNFLTINGFYKGPQDDISWNMHAQEENEFSKTGAQSESTLLFGRITYQMMAGFWPTPAAQQSMPEVAEGMNNSQKIVFSNTLTTAEWNNTQIVSGDSISYIRQLKQQPGNDITILGSGSLVKQFAEAGLIDEYKLMINPVALGSGTPIFNGINSNLNLELTDMRRFKSGVVLLCYKPAV